MVFLYFFFQFWLHFHHYLYLHIIFSRLIFHIFFVFLSLLWFFLYLSQICCIIGFSIACCYYFCFIIVIRFILSIYQSMHINAHKHRFHLIFHYIFPLNYIHSALLRWIVSLFISFHIQICITIYFCFSFVFFIFHSCLGLGFSRIGKRILNSTFYWMIN